MSVRRQKTQNTLALASKEKGEAPIGGDQGTETLVAKPASESPAGTEQLMEEVCARENLVKAWKRVRSNKGSPGVDAKTIDDATAYLRDHWPNIRSQLLQGTYRPLPADTDEAGHAFQYEAGHLFQSEAGRRSDLMSATGVSPPQISLNDVWRFERGQAG